MLKVNVYVEGGSKKTRGFNRIRRGIKRFLPSRRCFVLPLPTTNSAALTHVERLKDSELTSEFVDAVRELSNFVLGRTTGRVIGGRAMDGSSVLCSRVLSSLSDIDTLCD